MIFDNNKVAGRRGFDPRREQFFLFCSEFLSLSCAVTIFASSPAISGYSSGKSSDWCSATEARAGVAVKGTENVALLLYMHSRALSDIRYAVWKFL